MAGGQERVLRRRIKSVQSTKKITKAMELIAASRIVKAQQRVAAARPYSEQITEVIRNLAAGGAGLNHPLLKQRDEIHTVAYVSITADRGLAGGYNTNVIRATERAMRADREAGPRDEALHRRQEGAGLLPLPRHAHRGHVPRRHRPADLRGGPRDRARRRRRVRGRRVDTVELVYTQFLSAGSQRVVVRRFMPLDTSRLDEAAESSATASYEFEPGPDAILDRLLPRYAEARLFAALLDASASSTPPGSGP